MMKNSFILFIGSCIVILWANGAVALGVTGRTYDLCTDTYLRFSNVGDSGVIVFNKNSITSVTTNPCIIRIETCSSCQVSIQVAKASDMNFSCVSKVESNRQCHRSCDYLYIFDTYYMNKTLRFYHDIFNQQFRSESSNVFIGLCHNYTNDYHISLSFEVKAKLKQIDGSPSYRPNGPILSPFFPMEYSQNHETYEYNFTNQDSSGFVKLMFDDWHLASSSGFYFEDSNIVGLVGGESNRPVVISNKNNMLVKFHTGQSLSPTISKEFFGFKATYTFLRQKEYEYIPRTSCKDAGYIFNSYGGAVEFEAESRSRQLYDCLWVIQKQPGFTGVYLRVLKFTNPGFRLRGENVLMVKSGLTSNGFIVTEIDQVDNIEDGVPYKDVHGFYVRLNGTFTNFDRLQFVYASYKGVFECTGDLFQCGDGTCIHPSLKCDGYDHCGDNSDESRCGDVSSGHWDKSYQYTITIGVIIPMVISVFLIMVICLLFVMIRRCRRARMQAAGSVERLRTLSEDVTTTRGGSRRRRPRRNMFGERDQPPTYDEAMQNPPGWYLNVAFSNPVDPTLPQPPSYSEAVGQEGLTLNRARSGSQSSLDSSHSELTVCSHNRSVSSSSSDEGDAWGDYEEHTDGRRARRSRHVSSSNSETGTENQADPVAQTVGQQTVPRRSETQQNPRASPSADRSDNQEQRPTETSKVDICNEIDKTDKSDPKKVDRPTEFVIPETNKVNNEPKDHQSYASRIVQSVLGTRTNTDTNRGAEPRANHSRQRSMSSESEAVVEESKRKRKKKTRKGKRGKHEERHPAECLEETAAPHNMELVPYETSGASNYNDDVHSEHCDKPADTSQGNDHSVSHSDTGSARKHDEDIPEETTDYELVVSVDNDDVMLVYDTHFCDIPQNQARSVPEQIHTTSPVAMATATQTAYPSDSNRGMQSPMRKGRSNNVNSCKTSEESKKTDGYKNSGNNSREINTGDIHVRDAEHPTSHADVHYISFADDLGNDIYV